MSDEEIMEAIAINEAEIAALEEEAKHDPEREEGQRISDLAFDSEEELKLVQRLKKIGVIKK